MNDEDLQHWSCVYHWILLTKKEIIEFTSSKSVIVVRLDCRARLGKR